MLAFMKQFSDTLVEYLEEVNGNNLKENFDVVYEASVIQSHDPL